ncbi:MAG: M67 family metallopeptidase [Sphingomonadaceae bacterium]|nr:M67 family metallopeptidase [Sphingomonadaceae bacterium]
MALRISRTQRTQLLEWAEVARPEECCGLLFGRGGSISEICLTPNVAENPRSHFEIDPAALIAAHRRAREGDIELLGHFHSHPNGLGRPSSTDLANACADGRCWIIIADGDVSAWIPDGTGDEVVRFQQVSLVVEG